MKEQYSSWFVGDTVVDDGSMYYASPVDPLFILLPVLEKARGKQGKGFFSPIDQIISASDDADLRYVVDVPGLDLACVCDVNEGPSYRLNDDKVIKWLSAKTNRLADTLLQHNVVQAAGSNQSANLKTSNKKPVTRPELLSYAVGMIGEYISTEWFELLRKAFDLSEDVAPVDNKLASAAASAATNASPAGKASGKRPAEDTKSLAERKLAKVAQESKVKSVADFFKRK
eukprot:TRINITY_DN792_c0_g1_i2.p1 TRINITY_DN792_c0_g1~~TRINITY_DN792_c0_g1_i2.p1  ORF type:complete len:229 (+),score=63.58 TRINITY_DN792_c0_g1_i2:138-824(+)